MRCASCGRELDESIKFCDGCGKPVTPAAPAPSAPAKPAAPQPAPPPPKKKKGKCGCIAGVALVVLLILLILCLVGGFYGWRHGGREKYEQFRHRGDGGGLQGLALPAEPPAATRAIIETA